MNKASKRVPVSVEQQTMIRPEPPHGGLGEVRARKQTKSMSSEQAQRSEAQPPRVDVPTKPPRKKAARRTKISEEENE
jgi:hypothetical protein